MLENPIIQITIHLLITLTLIATPFFMVHFSHKNSKNDNQYYQGHRWTTTEINAQAIKRLEHARQQNQVSTIKYLFIKHFVLKLYIPKDKTKWGK